MKYESRNFHLKKLEKAAHVGFADINKTANARANVGVPLLIPQYWTNIWPNIK